MKTTLMLTALALIAGCARVPTRSEIANADYGAYPANYKEIVNTFIDETFNDPRSVQDLEVTEPVKFWFSIPPLERDAGVYYGYKVAFCCNAKNEFGGYTGKKWTFLYIKDGRVVLDITRQVALGRV